jgi:nickel/cobalt exporter
MRQVPRLAALVLCLLLGWASAGPLAANPFTGQSGEPATGGTGQVERVSGPVAAVGRALLTFQREANRLIATHMRAIRDGETPLALLVGVGLAFAYGVIHALGPGHGKLVVVSYFLARDAQIGRGLLMGLQIAVMHVLSAMVVVALADLLLRQAFGGPPAEVAGVRLASYGLIALIGGVMLVRRCGARACAARALSSRTRAAATAITMIRPRPAGRSRGRCRSASAWCRAPARC